MKRIGNRRVVSSCLVLAWGALGAWNSTEGKAEEGDTYVEPYHSIEMSAVEAGVIREILVKEGDQVTKGQELLRLDTEVIEAELAVAKAQAESKGRIMSAEAEHSQQKQRYEQILSLRKRGSSNQAEVDRESANLKSLEGSLLSAKEDQEIAALNAVRIQAQLDRRSLRSPIDGTVAEIVKDIAEPVSAGGSGSQNQKGYLVRVVQLQTLKATAFLPYRHVKDVKEGDVLEVEVLELDEVRRVKGTVEFVAPLIDPATATVAVRVKIDNSDRSLVSGSSARVLLPNT